MMKTNRKHNRYSTYNRACTMAQLSLTTAYLRENVVLTKQKLKRLKTCLP